MGKRIVIIDGNSLVNRAYYAIQRPMITRKGVYTHGVYGFINILTKIQRDYYPDALVVAFDRKAPTFRHLEYDQYKAGRKKMPDELAMQMPILKDVLSAMNIKSLEMDGFEADDIIGAVAKKAEEVGMEPLIITGDKDALQLITDKTHVLITKKGISEFDLFTNESFYNHYGFTPTQMIDYKALMGDTSDNIPGVPGVGEKTAQKLIIEFGTLDNILKNTDKISSKGLRTKLEENSQLALMSKMLATIQTTIPMEVIPDDFTFEKPDYKKLKEIYEELEFKTFITRLPKAEIKEEQSSQKNSEQFYSEKEESTTPTQLDGAKDVVSFRVDKTEDFNNIAGIFQKGGPAVLKVFSDNNHVDLPEITGLAIFFENQYFYFNMKDDQVRSKVFGIINSGKLRFLGHFLIQDYYALISLGTSLGFSKKEISFNTEFDTALGQYMLNPSTSKYDFHTMVGDYLGFDFVQNEADKPKEEQLDMFQVATSNEEDFNYGKNYCLALQAMSVLIGEKIKEEDLEEIFYTMELPLIEVLAFMEAEGFKVNPGELRQVGERLTVEIASLEKEIFQVTGEVFNISSPMQLGKVLFEGMGLPTGKKNKTGYSTSAEVLEPLRETYPIVNLILEYRQLTKLKSTYIDGLLPLIHSDGKVHPHFQQTVTATGRLSCTEPNLQNIPIRQEEGRLLRKAFIPREDNYTLVSCDYSQIELRILAHMSEDPVLLEGFMKGEDVHKITASKVFGVPEDQVTSGQRSDAKAVNFGVIYGMSSFGLSGELNITRKDAEKYISSYFEKYVNVKAYMDSQIAMARDKGFVTTILGRKRWIPEIIARNYQVRQLGERLAMNSPIQGSGADIMKVAMIKVHRAIRETGKDWALILQVHDELILEGPIEDRNEMETMLKGEMEEAVKLKVPLTVQVSSGDNWYELK